MNNVLILTGDFNIRNNNWNLLYSHYSKHTNILRKIADRFNLELSMLLDQVSTWYIGNPQDSNSVLDLIFFYANTEKFNNYMILLDF